MAMAGNRTRRATEMRAQVAQDHNNSPSNISLLADSCQPVHLSCCSQKEGHEGLRHKECYDCDRSSLCGRVARLRLIRSHPTRRNGETMARPTVHRHMHHASRITQLLGSRCTGRTPCDTKDRTHLICKSLLPPPAIYIRSKLVCTQALISHFSFARSLVLSFLPTSLRSRHQHREGRSRSGPRRNLQYRISLSSCPPDSRRAITNP
jgi:hypothetical protein